MRTIEGVVFLSERDPEAEHGSVLVEFDVTDRENSNESRARYSIYVVTPEYLTGPLRERQSVPLGKTSPIVVVRQIDDATVRSAIQELLPRVDELAKRIDIGAVD